MKRILLIGSAASVVIAIVVVLTLPLMNGGCRDMNTRIASRQLNTAPATRSTTVEDWPQYRGPRLDGISRETGLSFPSLALKALWAADVGIGYSSPIAAAGRVYLFSLNTKKETLTCFDAHAGTIIWSQEDDSGWTGGYPGTRATPAISGDAIFTYGGSGALLRRDLADGKPRWNLNILQALNAGPLGWGQASSPLVDDKHVYVQGGKNAPVAVAVNKDSGQIAWQSEFRGTGGYAQPILIDVHGKRQLIIFCAQGPVGMDPASGRTLWHQKWETSFDVNAATPVYREPHLLITSGYGRGSMMLKLSSAGAEKVWENKNVASKMNAPVLDGDTLYANSEGNLRAMSWPDGALRWQAKDSALRLGEGGSLIRFEDKLLMMSERGKVSIVRATPDGVSIISQAPSVEGTEVFSTPLIYGKRLYAKGTKELVCYELGE